MRAILLWGALGIIALGIYLIPAGIADYRRHNNRHAIAALNIVAGWTALGWLIALIWALTNNVSRSPGA